MSEQEKAVAEVARRNAKAAVDSAEKTRDELLERIKHLEMTANQNTQKITELEHKYNLLLTKNFNGKSTSGE